MIHVIAIISAKRGQRALVLDAVRANVPSVLAEHGRIEYQTTVDADPAPQFQTPFGSDTFVVIEN